MKVDLKDHRTVTKKKEGMAKIWSIIKAVKEQGRGTSTTTT